MSVAEDLADALAARHDPRGAGPRRREPDRRDLQDHRRHLTTTQEAFMTAVRVRLSVERARRALSERLARAGRGPRQRDRLGADP